MCRTSGSVDWTWNKSCGAVSSEETCWLCDDLTAWNRVMSTIGLELEESRPGMLLLRCSFDTKADSEQVSTVRQASFLASWLLCHHTCIPGGDCELPQKRQPSRGRTTIPDPTPPAIIDRHYSPTAPPVHQRNLQCSSRPYRPGRRHRPRDPLHRRRWKSTSISLLKSTSLWSTTAPR
ncbi:hypothetical protein MTO96_042714 [Rhipicephalus appendiculatus]